MFTMIRMARRLAVGAAVVGSLGLLAEGVGAANKRTVSRVAGETPRNIIFVLADDHRFDAMGFAGHPFLETPNLDRMAGGGAWFPNAFVTTSLCSPSRASSVTGQYGNNHQGVDDYNTLPEGRVLLRDYMQAAR